MRGQEGAVACATLCCRHLLTAPQARWLTQRGAAESCRMRPAAGSSLCLWQDMAQGPRLRAWTWRSRMPQAPGLLQARPGDCYAHRPTLISPVSFCPGNGQRQGPGLMPVRLLHDDEPQSCFGPGLRPRSPALFTLVRRPDRRRPQGPGPTQALPLSGRPERPGARGTALQDGVCGEG